MGLFLVFLLASLSFTESARVGQAAPPPPNLNELECSIHQYAYTYGSNKIRTNKISLWNALNIDQICPKDEIKIKIEEETALPRPQSTSLASTYYVATNGSDNNAGTIDAPFATLKRARDVIRTLPQPRGAITVYVRAGKYYLTETLLLQNQDSNVTYINYNNEKVTLSGGILLSNQVWTPLNASSPTIYSTKLPFTLEDNNNNNIPPHSRARATPPAKYNSLFVNGIRMVRARYPNGNPQDNSGMCFAKTQRPGEGCSSYVNIKGGSGNLPAGTVEGPWTIGPDRNKSPTYGTSSTNYGIFQYRIINPPDGHPVYNQPLPGLGWNNNSLFGFFGTIFNRTATITYDANTWTKKTWAHPETGVVHIFHGSLWGNFQFQINDLVASGTRIDFSYGGWQLANGGGFATNAYYVENIFEELDVPGEWFLDTTTSTLYHYPNRTDLNNANTKVVVPALNTLISINGTGGGAGGYPQAITISGFEFTETRSTFMEMYELPSGGDWTIHRGAALYVQDAERIVVDNCVFNQTGGNAVIFSRHVLDSKITNNEITLTGESAIVLLGVTNLIYGTQPTYPNRITITNNHIHDIGIYGKQTSCVFLSLAANATITDNVCYNGPRAGLNFNDGFGGGNVVKGNLVFNMVRETEDHGPYNSWDRQPYFTYNGINDGFNSSTCSNCPPGASIIRYHDLITSNLIINGYQGVWAIDHDDGSQQMNDTANVLVWGGCKNYLGNSKSCDHNLIIYPGTSSRSTDNFLADRRCQTDDNGAFVNQYHHDNDCILQDGRPYSWSGCDPNNLPNTVYQTWNNRFYAPNNVFTQTCGSTNYTTLPQWQQAGPAPGQDKGSSVNPVPDINTIIAMMDKILSQ